MTAFNIIVTILTIIGSLGIFLFGMILMSESLQKVAGKRMRNILSSITASNIKGTMTGLAITGAVQSSSAVTVMIVSFVNAGLLPLKRALGLIMGSNIGTTVTAWIITLIGFGQTFNLSWITLPLVALSLPLLLSGKSNQKSWAEVVIGFAILFLGLQLLKESIPIIDEQSVFVQQFQHLIDYGFFSILLFVGIGIVLTIIFQSSSAVMALTFVIAVDGYITFEIAAAMVLGENLGTTITANIAAIVGNRSAKRSALFHFIFNFIGVIWALIFFYPFIHSINLFFELFHFHSPFESPNKIPIAIATFHTVFNVINTILFSFTIIYFIRLLNWIIPLSNKKEKEKFRLKHMSSTYMSTSEISLIQAIREVNVMARLVKRMFTMIPALLLEMDKKVYEKLYKKVRKYEKIMDNIDAGIHLYLTKITESRLSDTSTEEHGKMLKIVDEIENIGDCCNNMATIIHSKNVNNIYFVQELRDNLAQMFEVCIKSLDIMIENLEKSKNMNLEKALGVNSEINSLRNRLYEQHVDSIKSGNYNIQTGMVYIELLNQCVRLSDHALNITKTLYR
jgi:phosphate:Na+ symporter